jgi:hypothetical protein
MLIAKPKKIIALFFLVIFSVQLFFPIAAMALTSGPSQPEMEKFQPAGANDMVDLFTGDMKYNIPLLDVGGYPVNISYSSGNNMEEEASWVGSGWTLNPGSVNRTMRGLPDDFDGTDKSNGSKGDKIQKEYTRKGFKKVGGSITLKGSILGWEVGNPSIKLNVYKDNYYGMGASIGAGVSFSQAFNSAPTLTAGLDLNSDVRDGVTLSPNFSLTSSSQDKQEDDYVTGTLSGTLNYNSRSGLKDVSLSGSFSTTTKYQQEDGTRQDFNAEMNQSAVHYFGQSYTPSLSSDTKNASYTFNFDLGLSSSGVYTGVGGSGYVYTEDILNKKSSVPAFGYLNYLKGRHNDNALLDYNREKDGVFLKSAPAIATPVATQDLFMATGQAGSFQFRPYFGGDYIIHDKQFSNKSDNMNAGITLGFGPNSFKAGARVEHTEGESRT